MKGRSENVPAAPNAGRDQRQFVSPDVSGHGDAGRSNGEDRTICGAMRGRCHGRDTRLAMLLPAVQVRRLSARLSFSKSVPCNIIVMATGSRPVEDYLKPKVISGRPSTGVTGLLEKNVVAYNFARIRQILDHGPSQKGPTGCCSAMRLADVGAPI
ncbi:hypothetical protein [Bradyrhizobium liaoningense]|uniref:hypothetical protein n=1 Tax=Bradyrhizobium liaoningense TaxID=43992 RepID=UPI001BA579F9|nr:hypothetical protein [Bradyrhizobium liaoningense]MBR0712354.1 hypothetical protein [Bradyrhizobium liaoningense]